MNARIFRAIVVDDERLARARLRRLLSVHDDIEVVHEARNVNEAAVALKEHGADVVFLDVRMPGADGFALLEGHAIDAHVVFVTAFDEHAVRAFDVDALDYLVKPVAAPRLASCLDRLRQANATIASAPAPIRVETARGIRLVDRVEVLAIRAAGDYSELHLKDGTSPMSRTSMQRWTAMLPPEEFMRVHRSTIVRLGAIVRFERVAGAASLWLNTLPEPFKVSRRVAPALERRLAQRTMPSS